MSRRDVLTRESAAAVDRVGSWVASLSWADVPGSARARLGLVVLDALAVIVAGARTAEHRAVQRAWDPPAGPIPLLGSAIRTTVEPAAWLTATALVRLELDEGHKLAGGHPAAHGLPAVLALACRHRLSGERTAVALLAAYEVAARFGVATTLRPGAHPHGSWGVAGAAAGCASVLGLDAAATAAAIDAGAGMPLAGHFGTALVGNRVRDEWMGAANVNGIAAARLAAAGLARSTGTPALSLGELLGTLDPAALTEGLGDRWLIEEGYLKRHASCSFTHPAADAVLQVRPELVRDGELTPIVGIDVETHRLATLLAHTTWGSTLGAMFSVPFVVAAVLRDGGLRPAALEAAAIDPGLRELAALVRVHLAPDLDAGLPGERAARVAVRTADGRTVHGAVPNPVGDAAYQPFDHDRLIGLLDDVIGPVATRACAAAAAALPTDPDIHDLLGRCAKQVATEEDTA